MEIMQKGFEVYEEELAATRIRELTERLDRAEVSADVLNEAYSDAVRQMFSAEDVGWTRLGGPNGDGPGADLAQAQAVAAKLSDWCVSNPLLKRGNEIRNSYLFSQPYVMGTETGAKELSPQIKNIIAKPENQQAVFSLEALEEIESQRFEAGNQFTLFDRGTKTFQQIPFDEVADLIYDPLNMSELRYVRRRVEYRTVGSFGQRLDRTYDRWIPVSNYEPASYLNRIDGVDVDPSKRMIVSRVNRKTGSPLGIPDAFAATPWALAYSAYLRDGTKVLAALAEWVWKMTPKKRPAAERAAAAVRKSGSGAGGTLFTDMDVQSLPTKDAVDLNTGRPLASQVAAALGISIVVLLADPGQSGAYGTAQTLADPNRRTMEARREVNSAFLRECLRLLGVVKPVITWGKMSPGTDLEEVQLLGHAWGTGLFAAEEIRPRIADVAQITMLNPQAPEGVMLPNNIESLARSDVDADGTTSQNNAVGRDNENVGAVSRTRTSRTQAGSESTK